jgi:hypothetical protein
MRRSPQEVVNTLAYALKEGRPGDEFKLSDLVKKTFMNHITITYYLDLIVSAQNNLPLIEVVEKKRNSLVRILKEVQLPFSEEEHVLLSFFDKGAFTGKTAVPLEGKPKDILDKLIASYMLMQVSQNGYLLPEGIIRAARLASERADAVISTPKQKIIDKGEILIEKWQYTETAEAKPPSNDQDHSSTVRNNSIFDCQIAI